MTVPDRNVLVTGASRGIGRACAETFARNGYRVTALARTATELTTLAEQHPQGIVPLIADLTHPVDFGTVPFDVLVLNAGYYAPGGLLDPDRDVFAESWELNVMANHRVTRQLLPAMVARGRGHLVAIGSVATDDTSPHMTAYAATKKALRALWEGWASELKGTGVLATLVAPGATLTSSWDEEAPPPKILRAQEVADLVYRTVEEGLSGRVVLKAGD